METQTRVVVQGVAESGYHWLHSEDRAEMISWRLTYEGGRKAKDFSRIFSLNE